MTSTTQDPNQGGSTSTGSSTPGTSTQHPDETDKYAQVKK